MGIKTELGAAITAMEMMTSRTMTQPQTSHLHTRHHQITSAPAARIEELRQDLYDAVEGKYGDPTIRAVETYVRQNPDAPAVRELRAAVKSARGQTVALVNEMLPDEVLEALRRGNSPRHPYEQGYRT